MQFESSSFYTPFRSWSIVLHASRRLLWYNLPVLLIINSSVLKAACDSMHIIGVTLLRSIDIAFMSMCRQSFSVRWLLCGIHCMCINSDLVFNDYCVDICTWWLALFIMTLLLRWYLLFVSIYWSIVNLTNCCIVVFI